MFNRLYFSFLLPLAMFATPLMRIRIRPTSILKYGLGIYFGAISFFGHSAEFEQSQHDSTQMPSIQQLTAEVKKTTELWSKLQVHLSLASPAPTKSDLLRTELQAQRNRELAAFNRLVEFLAQQEYQTFSKPQSITVESYIECKRLETKAQCIERARLLAIENAAKQGASYDVQARSIQQTLRAESNEIIEVEQTFSEQVDMTASAHVISFEVVEQQLVSNKITSEKVAQLELNALVAANKNSQYLDQIRAKYKSKLSPLLSKLVREQKTGKQVVIGSGEEAFTINLINIPEGLFNLGSNQGDKVETPVVERVVRSFYLADTEVTYKLFDLCVQEMKCRTQNRDVTNNTEDDTDLFDFPIVDISWQQIKQEFLPWLRKKTGERFRLPTETEWEYAAKFGQMNIMDVCQYGNIGSRECTTSHKVASLKSVAHYKSNSLGLYDMLGNAAEWTDSCWHNRHLKVVIRAQASCTRVVVKGGSWYDDNYDSRPSARGSRNITEQLDTLGFRLALDI